MVVFQESERPGCFTRESLAGAARQMALEIRWRALNPKREEDFIDLLGNKRVDPGIKERALEVLLAPEIKDLPFKVNTPEGVASYLESGPSWSWVNGLDRELAEQAAVIVGRNLTLKVGSGPKGERQAQALSDLAFEIKWRNLMVGRERPWENIDFIPLLTDETVDPEVKSRV